MKEPCKNQQNALVDFDPGTRFSFSMHIVLTAYENSIIFLYSLTLPLESYSVYNPSGPSVVQRDVLIVLTVQTKSIENSARASLSSRLRGRLAEARSRKSTEKASRKEAAEFESKSDCSQDFRKMQGRPSRKVVVMLMKPCVNKSLGSNDRRKNASTHLRQSSPRAYMFPSSFMKGESKPQPQYKINNKERPWSRWFILS